LYTCLFVPDEHKIIVLSVQMLVYFRIDFWNMFFVSVTFVASFSLRAISLD